MAADQSGADAPASTPTPTIASVLQDIYASQNMSGQTPVDCSQVSDDQFEKLGDAYMGNGITEAQHTAMENMMGGEGSATLKQVHISMGRAYLGCWAHYASPMAPMMSNYPAHYPAGDTMMNSRRPAADYYGEFDVRGWITTTLIWALLVSVIFAIWARISKKK